ncbi:cation:proton antiporter [Natrialba taiwanensis]|uniref:Sodium/hydrogen exchanger n=1 Tax=Natrialba taiwanensis DSM 12281 TaxID=1230458 RepID=L9ZXK5_9EURY|nr:cation:proton antiporter [Natrialba taiwanensis]ELY90816.1 sodium/hydrogen exchanger [Natrialba taiwanensis DSM 12281]
MAAESTALIDLGVLFGAAGVAGLVAQRINQSVIPWYILIGILLGPHVLGELPGPLGVEWTVRGVDLVASLSDGALADTDFVHVSAEVGIVLLLFFLGLEFNLDRLIQARDRIGKVGTVDFVVNFSAGLGLGWILFDGILPAFLTAGIVYISSSAIITKSIIDLGWIANDESEPLLGTLVYEDLVIAVYLAIASVLVGGGGDVGEALGQIGIAVGFLLVLLLAVSFGTDWVQRSLETDSHEFFVLRALGITIFVSGVALALGVSEAVAAFFVGMAFSSTDHVHDLENLLEPLRDTFAAVFFVWIGIRTDPMLFADGFVLAAIAAGVVLTAPTKLVSGYLGGRLYDLDVQRSVRVGLGMTTRGEFSLIIASLAISGAGTSLAAGTADTIYAFAIGYVLVMSVLGTTLMQHSDRIEAIVVPRLENAGDGIPQPGDD